MADNIEQFYEYSHTDLGVDYYRCIDCGCNEDKPVTDLDKHEQWHRDHPQVGERQTVADLQGLYEDDQYWSSDEPDEPQIVVPLAASDEAWARKFDRAADWLYHPDRPTGESIQFVGVQRFVPCSRRGTHRSLSECTLCAGDVARADARPEDVLVSPGDSEGVSHAE